MSDNVSKTQKIASATYLVTSFFDAEEPLKWKLRTLATDLVSERVKDKYHIVKETIALLAVAKSAGLVSEVNHNILAKELEKFAETQSKPLEAYFLEESFEIERALPQPQSYEPLKDKISEPKPKTEEKADLKDFGAVSVKKSGRQSTIISLLKRKKEIMIKDVSSLISGCSEKTIQRELLAMVAAGVLKKIGEKRWSRYTLARP